MRFLDVAKLRFSKTIGHDAMTDTLGRRIEHRREALGLGKLELASLSGIAQSTLSELESGKSKSISGLNLAKLCRELRVTPDYLMFGGSNPGDPERDVDGAEIAHLFMILGAPQRDAVLRLARGFLTPQTRVLPPGDQARPPSAPTPHH
jgi:transcriptional regulator with XRE-family HTH domain